MAAELHATRGDTLPDDAKELNGPGYWVSVCSTCGWEQEGRYGAGAEVSGLRMAHLTGQLHETAERVKAVRRG